MTRKIWKNETDHFSAESREDATRMLTELYNDAEHAAEYPFDEEPLADEQLLSIQLHDGYEGGRQYPAWADEEPEAIVEWVQEHRFRWVRVKAPARIWAKHETGMVCSTDAWATPGWEEDAP